MKQLTQSEIRKNGRVYKNVSSPATEGTMKQVTDIVEKDGTFSISTDGGKTYSPAGGAVPEALPQEASALKSGNLPTSGWNTTNPAMYAYTISDTSITANSDILMELTDDGGVKAYSMEAGKMTVIRDTVPTQPIPYTYKVKQTNASGQFTLVNHFVPNVPVTSVNGQTGAVTIAVPTKTSELENDSNFATTSDIPTKTSQLTNDSGFITAADIPSVGEWVDVPGETATLTEAGTYQVVLYGSDRNVQSIIYWDGSTAAQGIYSTVVDLLESRPVMVSRFPQITAEGVISFGWVTISQSVQGDWLESNTTVSGFKYRKIQLANGGGGGGGGELDKIYGVDLVGSASPSALTRTDDAVGLNVTVGTSEITSDFDNCYPWSNIEEVTDDAGNVFVKIPKFYSKITKNADGTYKHQLSGTKHEGFDTLFKVGAKEIDYVMVGKYEGSGSLSRVYSKSGETVLGYLPLNDFRTACKANGAGYQQYDFLIDLIIKELWLVEMKTTDSQSIMYGYANNNSDAIATGETDSVSTPSGSAVSNTDGKHSCKYRGIENLWGNTYTWCDGISFSGSSVYVCTDPASYTAGETASPYVYQGDRAGDGYIKKVEPLKQNSLIQYATEVSGSATTYFCDNTYGDGSALVVGGTWSATTSAGLWFWNGLYAPSDASSATGGRLCYKPTV